jgi:hypothetical protein
MRNASILWPSVASRPRIPLIGEISILHSAPARSVHGHDLNYSFVAAHLAYLPNLHLNIISLIYIVYPTISIR